HAPRRWHDVRRPFGGRRRRRMASPPPAGGGGRPGHPRASHRTADSMSILTPIDLATLAPEERRRLVRRSAVPDPDIRRGAVDICAQVRTGGDAAVAEVAHRVGGGYRRVTETELDAATRSLSPEVTEALESAVPAAPEFPAAPPPADLTVTTVPGVDLRRTWTPLRRIGAYVPGGKAAYPSSVVMTVAPARVAGVEEIVVASPAD